MTERQKMTAGELYRPDDPELVAGRDRKHELLRRIYALPDTDPNERQALYRELFGGTGLRFCIENFFRCDYGYNIYLGEDFYANFNCIMLDVAPIRFGDNVMLAPNVQLYTATHPLLPDERNSGREYAKPITVGHNVWIGGGAIVNPGVTIGDNAVIGSGSVVTRNVPAGVLAAGNPCRVIRPITEADRIT